MRHRNTEGLSELGKQIIHNCLNAYVNELGQVIDPCHAYFSELQDPTKWTKTLGGEWRKALSQPQGGK